MSGPFFFLLVLTADIYDWGNLSLLLCFDQQATWTCTWVCFYRNLFLSSIFKLESVLIFRDFNILVNKIAFGLIAVIDSFNLAQHVPGSPRVKGHTLDQKKRKSCVEKQRNESRHPKQV